MARSRHEYDDIPGSYIFDGRVAAEGYDLNKMCMSFNDVVNREEFTRDEEGYCKKYGLSDAQIKAVTSHDWLRLLQLGGNIYFLAKLATFCGENMQTIGSQMRGVSVEKFKQMLVDAGN